MRGIEASVGVDLVPVCAPGFACKFACKNCLHIDVL